MFVAFFVENLGNHYILMLIHIHFFYICNNLFNYLLNRMHVLLVIHDLRDYLRKLMYIIRKITFLSPQAPTT